MSDRAPDGAAVRRAWERHLVWLRGTWTLEPGRVERFWRMIFWYSASGIARLGEARANEYLALADAGTTRALPPQRRKNLSGARALAREIRVHPIAWCAGAGEARARLDAIHGIGPKIASVILRDLSFLRDFTRGTRRDASWFRRLADEEQAAYFPIDIWVHRAARRAGASPTIRRLPPEKLQANADLHHRAAAEVAAWARARRLDPRDLNVYWYQLGSGGISSTPDRR